MGLYEKLLQQNKFVIKKQQNAKNQMIAGSVFLVIGIILILWGQARVDYAQSCANNAFVYYDPSAIQAVFNAGNTLKLIGGICLIGGVASVIYGAILNQTKNKDEDAKTILDKRYAKGEITKEEFERMKKDLED
jgi:uncharacterized membrane protein